MKAHSLAEEAAMDTYFVARLPKWSKVLFGCNPLVRTSDWVEALVLRVDCVCVPDGGEIP